MMNNVCGGFNAAQEQLTLPLNYRILQVLCANICRSHVREGHGKDQEDVLEKLEELTEFVFLTG